MIPKSSIAVVTVLAAAVLLFSCSTTRSLEDGQFRLARNKVEIKGKGDKNLNPKEIERYIQQKANTSLIFGWNPFLGLYNLSGRDTTKLSSKILKKIGVAPVVYEPSMVEASKSNISRHLDYLGYYHSKVDSDVSVDGKKVEVKYTVTPGKRYKIGKISYSVPGGEFETDFMADTLNVSVKPGDYLAEATLETETERSASWMRRNGWFGFTRNYYSFEADTLLRRDTADLFMFIREYTRNQTPESARPFRKFSFGDVTFSWDKDLKFSDRVLKDMNTIRPGALYNEKAVNDTYSRLSSLKLFNGVNISLNPRDTADIVDCDINLSRSRIQGFKLNLEASTNSTGLIGVSPQLNYFHKNIFHGGQWLNLGFLGNFQFKHNDRSIRSNEFGVSGGISFPEFLGLPNTLFSGPNVPRTEINASFTYQNRPEYTRTQISTSYGYTGTLSRGRFLYQFYPVQAKIIRLQNIDPSFYDVLGTNLFLWNAYLDHFDVGSGAILYYTTSTDVNPKVSYKYLRLQLDASGNVLSLFNGSMKTDEFGERVIWGIPYSQYIRTELTLGQTFVFGRSDNQALALRLLGGIGHAYGNSTAVPFEKQFYSGGANSMRGWQARTLGPGRSKAYDWVVIPSQSGDVKLEANAEYRFPLFWKLQGALFLDVGNIWYHDDYDDGGSILHQENFLKSLAADWGGGVRVDLNFLILRLDMGIKLYDPTLDTGGWLGPSDWKRNDSYALHFGVGYPF